jgi:hypothetical protein
MGKKQKIRTGTGDIVSTPGPLHRQIEKANLATQKYKTPKKKHGGWTAAGVKIFGHLMLILNNIFVHLTAYRPQTQFQNHIGGAQTT